MEHARDGQWDPGRSPEVVKTLVVSQHEAVRRQLVAYLSRSPSLSVTGEPFSVPAILDPEPDVVILDLSQLERRDLRLAIEAVGQVGARLIALASIGDPTERNVVLAAGGIYRLKSAGADGLAEMIQDIAGYGPKAQ